MNSVAPLLKYPYKSNVRWALMQWADIKDASRPDRVYLRRLRIVQCPLFALYLHFIYTEDRDRHLHNHPMNFWSLVLRGGYIEQRLGRDDRVRERWSIARTSMRDYHRIFKLFDTPTITLLFVGKRSKSWGFMVEGKHVDKDDYLARPPD